MKRDLDAASGTPAAPDAAALALAAIESSRAFASSRRHRALLRHLVERSLAGDVAALKESLIGVEVFGRPATTFDPKSDSIVRVEARRLRGRLAGYYAAEGADAAVRIELPVGSYVPQVVVRSGAPAEPELLRRARDWVERGEHFLRQPLSEATLGQALERFDQALRLDPTRVDAHVGMARAWLNLATGWYRPPAEASEHALEALRQALALDAAQPVAHALLGALLHQHEHDWPAAERSFRRALARAPEHAFVHSAYGCHLLMRGRFDDAERELLLARRLDPQYVNTRMHLVNLRIAQRRLDEAHAELEAMRDLAPESIAVHGLRGVLAMLQGDADAAVAIYEDLVARLPDQPAVLASLAAAHAEAGRIEQADAVLAELGARFADRVVSPYVLAIVETRARRFDAAFARLDQAWHERDPLAVIARHDVSFDALHADPRWPALVERIERGARGALERRRTVGRDAPSTA